MKPSTLRHVFNLWPPSLFTGIHVSTLSKDWRHARVALRMRPWNRNYVGSHFGGSLFAMSDPFWMMVDAQGEVVARVRKQLYVRRKRSKTP